MEDSVSTVPTRSRASTSALDRLRAQIDRAGYQLQQGSLAASCGLLSRTFHAILQPGLGSPTLAEIEAIHRRFLELLAEDLANVEGGIYPRDLLFQLPLRAYLRVIPEALLDAPRIIQRRRRGEFDDLPKDIDPAIYPAYYRRNFHWQTDGWLSDRSARLYDVGVEILFGGTADVMRRMALPPILEVGRAGPELRVLDVGCGTGRFLHQLRRAAPHARLYGVDLSPNYLARARALLDGDAAALPATFLAENAECLPFRDATFDVVSSIFLFHELPSDVRRNVAREALRVLRPGGRFVICDSAQIEDSAELGFFIEAFHSLYHEPYFKGYLRDDLSRLLSDVGFETVTSSPRFVSRIVVGTKGSR